MVPMLSSPPVMPDPLSCLHWAVMLLLQDATLEKVTGCPCHMIPIRCSLFNFSSQKAIRSTYIHPLRTQVLTNFVLLTL